MRVDNFAAGLDHLFHGEWTEGIPKDNRFVVVAEEVVGYSTPAELAVLHAAVAGLPEGESYLEVGTFKGRSICGALIDGTTRPVYAIENFQEFGMSGHSARNELYSNLDAYTGATPSFRLIEGDCFRLLARAPEDLEPIGVYFYDGAHTWLAHYLALAVVEHRLADEALVLVDDASWPVVRRATEAYIARHPGWSVVRLFEAAYDHDPRWANGLLLLRFVRPANTRKGLSVDTRLLLLVQRWLATPFYSFAWRVVPRSSVLIALGRRFFGRTSHRVPASESGHAR